MAQSTNSDIQNTLEKIRNHMEFLGYEVELDDDSNEMLAKHPEKTNVLVRCFSNAVRFMSFYFSNEHAKQERLKFLELINHLNLDTVICQYSVDNEGALIITAWFFSNYDKVLFGQFLEIWHEDLEKLHGTKGVREFFS